MMISDIGTSGPLLQFGERGCRSIQCVGNTLVLPEVGYMALLSHPVEMHSLSLVSSSLLPAIPRVAIDLVQNNST
jgi:hypothetical protein